MYKYLFTECTFIILDKSTYEASENEIGMYKTIFINLL